MSRRTAAVHSIGPDSGGCCGAPPVTFPWRTAGGAVEGGTEEEVTWEWARKRGGKRRRRGRRCHLSLDGGVASQWGRGGGGVEETPLTTGTEVTPAGSRATVRLRSALYAGTERPPSHGLCRLSRSSSAQLLSSPPVTPHRRLSLNATAVTRYDNASQGEVGQQAANVWGCTCSAMQELDTARMDNEERETQAPSRCANPSGLEPLDTTVLSTYVVFQSGGAH